MLILQKVFSKRSHFPDFSIHYISHGFLFLLFFTFISFFSSKRGHICQSCDLLACLTVLTHQVKFIVAYSAPVVVACFASQAILGFEAHRHTLCYILYSCLWPATFTFTAVARIEIGYHTMLIWHLNTGSAFMHCYEWHVLRTKSGKSMWYKWWGLTTESGPVGWDYRTSLCSQSVLLFTLIRTHGQLQKKLYNISVSSLFQIKMKHCSVIQWP